MVVSSKQTRGVLPGRALRVVKNKLEILTHRWSNNWSIGAVINVKNGGRPPVSSRALCVCICEIVGVFCVCVFVCGRPFV